MADEKKTTEADAKALAAARKAEQDATEQAQADAAKATEEARQRDLETLKAQEEAVPYPSQEEADRIKVAAASGSAPYTTRDLKA